MIFLAAVCLLLLAGCVQTPVETTPPTTTEATAETTLPPVVITGGPEELILEREDTAAELTHSAQIQSLTDQADELPHLQTIRLTGEPPTARQILSLREAFPNAEIAYDRVELLGNCYDADITQLDLTALTADQVTELTETLSALPCLTEVYLTKDGKVGPLPLEDAAALQQAYPELKIHYAAELFGQVLSTDMETVEYFKEAIGDEGLAQFRLLLPMMYNLTYLRLDWCQTSDEAMAALRDEYAGSVKVVWRVFFGKFNCLTDTFKIWANGLETQSAQVLKYCTEVKYLDIGHSPKLENVDFLGYMPELEVAIIADCKLLTSIEPLRNCPKLEYLEVFTTGVSDLSPLENLTNLQHLNISGTKVTDLSPIHGLSNLKRLWSNRNDHLKDQVAAFHEMYPDCRVLTNAGHPVNYQWRYTTSEKTTRVSRYALLRLQIGYGSNDQSCYPKGYLREEITYESTGITPD